MGKDLSMNPQCPECGGLTIRKGSTWNNTGTRYKCKTCAHPFRTEIVREGAVKVVEDTRVGLSGQPADVDSGVFKELTLKSSGNVLAFSCVHLPYEHPKYLDFLKRMRDFYKCDTIINLGDFLDHHMVSFHDKNPDGHSAGREIELVCGKVLEWVKEFPSILATTGNHDQLPQRNAFKNGVPNAMIRTVNEIYGIPETWKWYDRIRIGDVLYHHGTGRSGKNAAQQWMDSTKISNVIGHVHSNLSVTYSTTPYDRHFAMSVGCGISPSSFAFAYNKSFGVRPVLGCAVVLDGGRQPIPIPMYL